MYFINDESIEDGRYNQWQVPQSVWLSFCRLSVDVERRLASKQSPPRADAPAPVTWRFVLPSAVMPDGFSLRSDGSVQSMFLIG